MRSAELLCGQQYPEKIGNYLLHTRCVTDAVYRYKLATSAYPDLLRRQEEMKAELSAKIDQRSLSPQEGNSRWDQIEALQRELVRDLNAGHGVEARRRLAEIDQVLHGSAGSDIATSAPPISSDSRSSATAQLLAQLDQIVTEDSKSWAFYTYKKGSINNATASQNGADTIVKGYFQYENGGPNAGWVEVKLQNGKFTCLRYSDAPNDCRQIGKGNGNGLATLVVAGALLGLAASMAPGNATSTPPPSQPEETDSGMGLAGHVMMYNLWTTGDPLGD